MPERNCKVIFRSFWHSTRIRDGTWGWSLRVGVVRNVFWDTGAGRRAHRQAREPDSDNKKSDSFASRNLGGCSPSIEQARGPATGDFEMCGKIHLINTIKFRVRATYYLISEVIVTNGTLKGITLIQQHGSTPLSSVHPIMRGALNSDVPGEIIKSDGQGRT